MNSQCQLLKLYSLCLIIKKIMDFSRLATVGLKKVLAYASSESFVSYEELLERAEPGDLIEFNRGTYSHWAMYAGKGNVYNICAEHKQHRTALIKLQSLKEVCELASERDYQKVRINNHEVEANFRNLKPLSAHDSLRAAEAMNNQEVAYNFFKENCEYYCTSWKYGSGFSEQVDTTVEIGKSLLLR